MTENTSQISEPVLRTEVVDRIGTITLNRPGRRNALNGELILALDEAVKVRGRRPQCEGCHLDRGGQLPELTAGSVLAVILRTAEHFPGGKPAQRC